MLCSFEDSAQCEALLKYKELIWLSGPVRRPLTTWENNLNQSTSIKLNKYIWNNRGHRASHGDDTEKCWAFRCWAEESTWKQGPYSRQNLCDHCWWIYTERERMNCFYDSSLCRQILSSLYLISSRPKNPDQKIILICKWNWDKRV